MVTSQVGGRLPIVTIGSSAHTELSTQTHYSIACIVLPACMYMCNFFPGHDNHICTPYSQETNCPGPLFTTWDTNPTQPNPGVLPQPNWGHNTQYSVTAAYRDTLLQQRLYVVLYRYMYVRIKTH